MEPTLHLTRDDGGYPMNCIAFQGLAVQHQQLWQAEIMLESMAREHGVRLPAEWLKRPLGGRTMWAR